MPGVKLQNSFVAEKDLEVTEHKTRCMHSMLLYKFSDLSPKDIFTNKRNSLLYKFSLIFSKRHFYK